MAKAVKRPAEATTYILVSDRRAPAEEQSRFILRPMTQAERITLRDDAAHVINRDDGTREILHRTHAIARLLALTCIASIENFPAGAPQTWPTDIDARALYLEQLRDEDVIEIGNEVWDRGILETARDGALIKNSSTPGPISSSGVDSPMTGLSTLAPDATPIPA